MKIVVDMLLCESNGLCVGAAPDVFELGDDDELKVLVEEPGDDRRAAVEQAARICPKQAITVEG